MIDRKRIHQDQPGFYQIQVDGQIGRPRYAWFDNLLINIGDKSDAQAITTLSGELADQAALMGTLHKLYTLGFTLLSVRRMEKAEPTSGKVAKKGETENE
jgi:hypothetical protein